jgi:ribosomal protein S18 acetylase RimI-like enzyme
MSDSDVTHQWVTDLDADATRAIVTLVDCASGDGGTLGYAEPMAAVDAQAFVENLRRRVKNGESHVLLGRVGGLPAFLAVLTLNGMPNCRHRAELSKGVVHPDFRGRHFVQLGFREMVRRAQQLGVEQLVLDVREGSRAHQLWQRFGFETFGVLQDYARVGGAIHRGHFMVQTVASLRARLWADTPASTDEKDKAHA